MAWDNARTLPYGSFNAGWRGRARWRSMTSYRKMNGSCPRVRRGAMRTLSFTPAEALRLSQRHSRFQILASYWDARILARSQEET